MSDRFSTSRASVRVSERDVDRLLSVIEIQNELAGAALDLHALLSVVAGRAAELCDADAAVVAMLEGDEMVLRAAGGTASEHLGLRLDVAESLSGTCVTEGRTLRCDDAATDDRVDGETARAVGAISILCVPLQDGAGVSGALNVHAARRHAFDDADETILTQLGRVIVAHMRRAEEFERNAFESRHDLLTDLGNRRAYEERLVKEAARTDRYGHALSVALFDLDGFKRVNDVHGHPAGDEVLRRVGRVLQAARRSDDCYRVGGDEFALVVPETDHAGGVLAAERVAEAIGAANRDVGVTASFGVASFAGGDWSDLHAAADARLLAAKRSRR